MQFQYASTDVTDQFDAFSFRRLRPIFDYDVTKDVSARIMLEAAGGPNRYLLQTREVYVAWQPTVNFRGRAGQVPVPLGYEIARLAPDLDFTERAQYNVILFNGEDVPGVEARARRKGWEATAGLYNGMTVNDPEQVNRTPGADSRLAGVAEAALVGSSGRLAISGLYGERAAFTNAAKVSPAFVRKFVTADAEYRRGPLTLRGEGFFGRDRLSGSFPGRPQDMAGGHLMGAWRFDRLDSLALRYEMFDPPVNSTAIRFSAGTSRGRAIWPRTPA